MTGPRPDTADEGSNALLMRLRGFSRTLSDLPDHLERLTQRTDVLEGRFTALEERLTTMETRFTNLEDRLTDIQERQSALEGRFGVQESRLTDIQERQTTMERRFSDLENRFTDIQERFTPLQLALEQLQKDLSFLPQLASELDRVRPELAELRVILQGRLEAEIEESELVGRLLRGHEARIAALEGAPSGPLAADTGAEPR